MVFLTTHYSALQSIAGITSERFSALVTGELQVEVRLVSLWSRYHSQCMKIYLNIVSSVHNTYIAMNTSSLVTPTEGPNSISVC